ncbi:MAG: S1 RNA-binding domain-containing protein [Bacillota bacterium]
MKTTEKKTTKSRRKTVSATPKPEAVETSEIPETETTDNTPDAPASPGAGIMEPTEDLQAPPAAPSLAPEPRIQAREDQKPPAARRPVRPLNVVAEGFTGQKKSFGHDPYPELYASLQTGTILQGTVLGVEPFDRELGKQALVVDLGSAKGVIVEDDLGDHPKNLANMIGATVAFRVKGIDREKGVAYLSRKAALDAMASRTWRALEEEAAPVIAIQAKITAVMDELKKEGLSSEDRKTKLAEMRRLQDEARHTGPARTCTVKWVLDRLAFVDVGGVTAFLPAKEMAYGFVPDAREVVRPGDSFDVRVYHMNREAGKVFVTLKPFLPDPWATASLKYRKGGLYLARVTRVVDKGLVLSLEQGVEMFSSHLPFGSPGLDSQVLVHVRDVDSARRRITGHISRVLKKVG